MRETYWLRMISTLGFPSLPSRYLLALPSHPASKSLTHRSIRHRQAGIVLLGHRSGHRGRSGSGDGCDTGRRFGSDAIYLDTILVDDVCWGFWDGRGGS